VLYPKWFQLKRDIRTALVCVCVCLWNVSCRIQGISTPKKSMVRMTIVGLKILPVCKTYLIYTRERQKLSAFLFFQFIYTNVGLNKYVIFLHSVLPFRCTWSSGPQACVFLPRRFSVGRATIYVPLPALFFVQVSYNPWFTIWYFTGYLQGWDSG
jgi:hypothetical protein